MYFFPEGMKLRRERTDTWLNESCGVEYARSGSDDILQYVEVFVLFVCICLEAQPRWLFCFFNQTYQNKNIEHEYLNHRAPIT